MSDIISIQQKRWQHNGPTGHSSACYALGLAGESGEVADLIKKRMFHGVDVSREMLVDELGDVLWYLCMLAQNEGISLCEIEEANWQKVLKRYPSGFVKGGGNRGEQTHE